MEDELIPYMMERFSKMNITQEDIDRLNAVNRAEREKILNQIPKSEEILCTLCIDEDINGDFFFIKG